MKRKIISCLISLTVLGTGLIAPSKSGAEPALIFSPLIDDIRSQLPPGLKIRLPSSLPSPPPNVKLFPYILSDNKVFGINLAVTPDCASSKNPSSCTVGGIGVFTLAGRSRIWPPKGNSVTPVDLGNGIRGFYLTRGKGNHTNQYVFWQQDGLEYILGAVGPTKDVSQEQLIDTAISAVNEPPITSRK